jgi:hypothetical protein
MEEKELFTLETPRGNLKIRVQFETGEEAQKHDYYMYFTHDNFDIDCRQIDSENRPHSYYFAVVKKDVNGSRDIKS